MLSASDSLRWGHSAALIFTIDLTISKGIGKNVVIKAGVQDLLAQDMIYLQDSDENGDVKINGNDDEVIRMRRGAYYTLGISVNL